jgi:serine/threonine-protein kinase
MMPEAPALESRPRLLTFGPFGFDPQTRLLFRDGVELPLPPRVLGVLELLVSRPGEIVPRQELLDRVWKDAFVTDTSLAEAISFLRQALGDDPQAPRYVQTVHRRGYRFLPVLTTPAAPPPPPTRTAPDVVKPSIVRELAPWSIAAVCTAIAATALWYALHRPVEDAPPVVRFELRPAAGTSFDRRAPAIAIAPDGRTAAWSGCDAANAACVLWVRPLDRLEPVALRGTDGATAPFFSPDGRWIGFFADGKLKKITAAGGAPTTLADAPAPGGASWNADGRIVFSGRFAGGLASVPDQGGEVRTLTQPHRDRGELRHAWPSWLPDGRAILFTIATSPVADALGQLAVLPQPSAAPQPLRGGVARAVSAGRGYLLFSTPTDLQAQRFDDRSLALAGAPEGVLESLASAQGLAQASANDRALIAVNGVPREARFSWADDPSRAVAGLARLAQIALAPDGRRAAGVIADATGSDIWIADLDRGTTTRLTYGGTNALPVWTPDGRVLYASRSAGPFSVSVAQPGGAGPRLLLKDGSHVFPGSASTDGTLATINALDDGRLAIGLTPRDGGKPVTLNDGPFDQAMPAFAPGGGWLAFTSDEGGRWQVSARRLSDGRRVAVSTEGGERPSWSADGRWIYFHDGRRVRRASFEATTGAVGAPEVVFDRPHARAVAVTPAGRVLVEETPAGPDVAIVVLQWLREVRQKLVPPVTAPR